MKLRIFLLFFFLVLAACAANMIWNYMGQMGPSYEGRTLSRWLLDLKNDQVLNTNKVMNDKAAIRNIGTNAIPTLLEMATYHESRFKQNVLLNLSDETRRSLNILDGEDYFDLARDGFAVLGPIARPAVPFLLNATNASIKSVATDLIAAIGPAADNAIPVLVDRFNRENDDGQLRIIIAIGAIHSYPDLVIPILCSQLDNPKETKVNRIAVLIALGNFGREAGSAASKVKCLMNDGDIPTRIYATNTYNKIYSPSVKLP